MEEQIDHLCEEKLFYKINKIVKYLTDYCQVIFFPDGTAYAADNKSGKLTRWAMKHFN